MKSKISKDQMTELALNQLLMNGFYHTNVREVMMSAGLNKGSFANYFQSKEEMAFKAMDMFTNRLLEWQMAVDQMDLSPIDKFTQYFDALIEHFAVEMHCKGGCLVGNFSSELADVEPGFQEKLDEFLVKLNTKFSEWISDAQTLGQLSDSWDPYQLAEMIMMSWEGSVLRMKTTGKIWPLETFRDKYLKSIFNINH